MISPLDGGTPPLPTSARSTKVGAGPTPPAEDAGTGVSSPGVSGDLLPATPVSDRGYALALLFAALAAPHETGGSRGGEDVAAALGRAARLLPLAQAAVFARLLQPIAADLPGADVREALREHVEASGVFLEARLRLALQALPGSTGQELLERLPPDIRVLLALTCRTGVPPVDEPSQRAAADAVLRQQAEVAYRWLHEGTFAFELPVRLPTEESRLFVEFEREGSERGGEQRPKESVLRIHVESRVLGPVAVEARWRGAACDARFFVADQAACTALQNEAESLRAALTPVFARPSVEVIVDGGRAARRPPDRRPDLPPGGSLLSVRT